MGGSSPKQKVSAQETQQAKQAVNKWNERLEDGYIKLESDTVADAQLDHSGYLAGRTSADTAAAEQQVYQSGLAAGGPRARTLQATGDEITAAVSAGQVDSKLEAKNLKDSKMVTAMNRGNNVAGNSANALSKSAGLASSRAQNRLQNSITKSNAKTAAWTQALGAAVNRYDMNKAGYKYEGNKVLDPNGNELETSRLGLAFRSGFGG